MARVDRPCRTAVITAAWCPRSSGKPNTCCATCATQFPHRVLLDWCASPRNLLGNADGQGRAVASTSWRPLSEGSAASAAYPPLGAHSSPPGRLLAHAAAPAGCAALPLVAPPLPCRGSGRASPQRRAMSDDAATHMHAVSRAHERLLRARGAPGMQDLECCVARGGCGAAGAHLAGNAWAGGSEVAHGAAFEAAAVAGSLLPLHEVRSVPRLLHEAAGPHRSRGAVSLRPPPACNRLLRPMAHAAVRHHLSPPNLLPNPLGFFERRFVPALDWKLKRPPPCVSHKSVNGDHRCFLFHILESVLYPAVRPVTRSVQQMAIWSASPCYCCERSCRAGRCVPCHCCRSRSQLQRVQRWP